jgi:hypothetical protein
MGLGIVFAGCGGTFWTATPFLSALLKKIRPDLVAFVDPDFLTAENKHRQWVTSEVERAKASLAAEAVLGADWRARCITEIDPFPESTRLHPEVWARFNGVDLIVVCNVDTNQARLNIRNWCRQREGFCAMVVSGCDRTYGQVYYGIWQDREALLDWLPAHPDVEEQTQPRDACGQNIMSNAQTGVFLGWAIQDVVSVYINGTDVGKEYYWKKEGGKVKSWMDEVPIKEVVHVN